MGVALLTGFPGTGWSQLSLTVGTGTGEVSLSDAIQQADNYTGTSAVISIDAASFTNNTMSLNSQMIIGLNSSITGGLTINGNGVTIDMGGSNRAFFVASGAVGISNLTIANGAATGGAGADGAGGGAGLGGAIFVANPASVANGTTNANLTLPTAVTLTNVSFSNNSATGGQGAGYSVAGQGGGGGMGGTGGVGFYYDPGEFSPNQHGGGGGGGFGRDASGGSALAPGNYVGAGPGDFAGWFAANPASGGDGGSGIPNVDGGGGGLAGGGGGASAPAAVPGTAAGGGGGIGGKSGNAALPNGGFGGGGGGSGVQSEDFNTLTPPGNGGFGGGGGAGDGEGDAGEATGDGGFGGGGGSSIESSAPLGTGGFGAGNGVNVQGIGGGGAGLGGALFVMNGASLTIVQDNSGGTVQFAGSTVTGGQTPSGGNAGSAYGADLFLGSDVTFDVTGSLTLDSLGGAGNLNDPNVSSNSTDSNAQGGVILTGGGTLTLTGSSYYTGQTKIEAGTLILAAGAKEIGTKSITVGTTGNATLVLQNDSNIGQPADGVAITLGQNAGVQGTLTIGNGGNGAGVGYSSVTTGAGTGVINFNETAAFGGTSSIYPFYPVISGSIAVFQNGAGTTLLAPSAANTYTGGTVINAGVLQAGSASALPVGGAIQIQGGSLDLNGNTLSTGALTLTSGSLVSSVAGGTLNPSSVTASSGAISAQITGTGVFQKQGAGTVTLSATDSSTGAVLIGQGTLALTVSHAISSAQAISLSAGATLSLQADSALNDTSLFDWSGGTIETTGSSLSETLGATTVDGVSLLDAGAGGITMTLVSLDISSTLDVWNWNTSLDSLLIPGGILSGDASSILFYSDNGTTYLGHGQLDGSQVVIIPVPEPAVWSYAVMAAAFLGFTALRRLRA